MIKLAKMPQNMKSSNRFRTVFDSAVLRQLFQAPYYAQNLETAALAAVSPIEKPAAFYFN